MYEIIFCILASLSILFLVSNDKLSEKDLRIVYIILLIANAIIIALRPEETPDFLSYKRIYEYIRPGKNYGINLMEREHITGLEYGFVYLTALIKYFVGNNYRLYLFIINISTVFGTIEVMSKLLLELDLIDIEKKTIYRTKLTMACLFFSYYLINYQGIAIRQAVAFVFCLTAFYYFACNKVVYSIIAYILAFSMQRMSILGVLLVFAYKFFPTFKEKKNYRTICILLFFSFFLFDFLDLFTPILAQMQKVYIWLFGYLNYRGYIEGISMVVIMNRKKILLLILFGFMVFFIVNKESFIKLLNVYLLGLILMIITSNIAGAARIYDYLIMIYVPIIGAQYYEERKNIYYKIGLVLFVIMNYYVSYRVWTDIV